MTVERRRAFRVDTCGTYARCWCERRVGRYTVQNLSLSGTLLHGSPTMAPGADVEVLLRLPGTGEVRLDGRVLRSQPMDRAFAEFAVTFNDLTADAEDAICATVMQEVQRARSPVVVTTGVRRSVLRMMQAAARRRGIEVRAAHTPLDLIRLLEDLSIRVVAVGIGTRSPRVPPVEISGFLANLYPHVRRVLVGRAGWRTRLATHDLLHESVRLPMKPERLVDKITGEVPV